jgi:predicted transcriptional regulator
VASIWYHGHCPCPHCIVLKVELSQFSSRVDILQCTSLAHVENHARRRDIEEARRKIYKEQRCVNTKFVEELLKGESQVPTLVSN